MNSRFQAYLRAAAANGRDVERIGPLIATFTMQDANPYLNYAIPDDDAKPNASEVSALVEAFHKRDRVPRLEYFPAAAPDVESALVASGFVAEGRLPVLTCTRPSVRVIDAPSAVTVEVADGVQSLWSTVCAIGESYGSPSKDRSRIPVALMEALKASGVVYVMARDSGGVVGGGLFSDPIDGLTEIASLGVVPAHRRRGIGAALTSRLTREAFERGATMPWLMAGHPTEERIFIRVGYVRESEILHISIPATGGGSRV